MKPRRGRMDRATAMRLAAGEYRRFADALTSLDADDWTRPTDCLAWDVRLLACHVVGMAEMAAGIREGNRQRRIAGADAAREGIPFIDALTALQVKEREDWSAARVVDAARDVGPRAARGRRRTPFFLRRLTMPVPQEVNGREEDWTIGYLVDTILTRDPWMHRVDVAAATGRPLDLTPEHDGAIVADVVEEWAERHGRPYSLTLTGPAGGSWSRGTDGPSIQMDAIEFCRGRLGTRHHPRGAPGHPGALLIPREATPCRSAGSARPSPCSATTPRCCPAAVGRDRAGLSNLSRTGRAPPRRSRRCVRSNP